MEFVHFHTDNILGNFTRRTGVLPKIPPSGKIYNSYSEKGKHLAVAFYKRIITSRGDPITLQIIPQAITQLHDFQLEIRAQNQVSFYEVKLTISPLATSQFFFKKASREKHQTCQHLFNLIFYTFSQHFHRFSQAKMFGIKVLFTFIIYSFSTLDFTLIVYVIFCLFLVLFLKQQDTEASRTHFNLSPCICCVSIKLPFENLVFSFVLTLLSN